MSPSLIKPADYHIKMLKGDLRCYREGIERGYQSGFEEGLKEGKARAYTEILLILASR